MFVVILDGSPMSSLMCIEWGHLCRSNGHCSRCDIYLEDMDNSFGEHKPEDCELCLQRDPAYDAGWESGRDFQAEQFAKLAKEWADAKDRIKELEGEVEDLKYQLNLAKNDHPYSWHD